MRALDEKQAQSRTALSDRRTNALSGRRRSAPPSEAVIRDGALKTLQDTVAGLNLDNFLVRQHRRAVEKYREAESVDSDRR